MSHGDTDPDIGALRRALVTIRSLKSRLDDRIREPLAVVGMACRFPGGATDLAAYWELLAQGRHGVVDVPAERWNHASYYDADPGAANKTYTRHLATIGDVTGFDAEFFGISPREAEALDPQHRLLLETTWEALADGGVIPEEVAGTRAGVFVGLSTGDYSRLGSEIGLYSGTGTVASTSAGRISYLLGARGPSVAVDTACSSSLVAVHLAAQSLRAGESDLAICAGVNLVLWPYSVVTMAKLRALSKEGRCRAFDAAADGYVRGEGAGAVVLKRLSDARAARDRIWGVIRGSAVNHDGRSNGLTAPNGPSQSALIREALRIAGVEPRDVGYVEAHGTGTPLGDPIEIAALDEVMRADREPSRPLLVGSVKSNLGHLEAAAGIAGLIKAILSMERGVIPASLHFETPNPEIAWDQVRIEVPRSSVSWPEGERIAGVSSFGFSGTNAHVVVAQAPAVDDPATNPGPFILPLSAKRAEALGKQAALLADFLERPTADVGSACFTAARHRSHHAVRHAVVARSREQLCAQLREVETGCAAGTRAEPVKGGVAFVFSGHGSQWTGMCRDLLVEQPAFRDKLEQCSAIIEREAGWALIDELTRDGSALFQGRTQQVQPAIVALQIAFADLWKQWGVVPEAVIGHSLGEFAAFHIAGALTLEDALKLVCRRTELLREVYGRGSMALVELSFAEAKRAIRGQEQHLAVAVETSPSFSVISGDSAVLQRFLERLKERGTFCRAIDVDYASHSHEMEPLREKAAMLSEGIRAQRAATPIYSPLTGEVLQGQETDPDFFFRNLREPVLFASAVRAAAHGGCRYFVELSPHPLLLPSIEQTLREQGLQGVGLASSQRDEPGLETLLRGMAQIYAAGRPVRWDAVCPRGRIVSLPGYPWLRKRHWLEEAGGLPFASRSTSIHPLLGEPAAIATHPGSRSWPLRLETEEAAYLRDHRVDGTAVLPAAAVLELAATVGGATMGPCVVSELQLHQAVPVRAGMQAQVVVEAHGDTAGHFYLFAREENEGAWTLSAHAALSAPEERSAAEQPARRTEGAQAFALDALYAALLERGLDYGPTFRCLSTLAVGSGWARSEVSLPSADTPATGYQLHPSMLDGCLQTLGAAAVDDIRRSGVWIPVRIGAYRIARPSRGPLTCHAEARVLEDGDIRGEVDIRDADGHVAALTDVRLKRLHGADSDAADRLFHAVKWELSPEPPRRPSDPGAWLLVGADVAPLQALADRLGVHGKSVTVAALAPSTAGFSELLRSGGHDRPWQGVVFLAHEHDGHDALRPLLGLAQALALNEGRDRPRLYVVTRVAQAVLGHEQDLHVVQAGLWGFTRTLAMEHPDLRPTLVDLDRDEPSRADDALVRELLADSEEQQIAIRGHERFVARIDAEQLGATESRRQRRTDQAFRVEIGKPGDLGTLVCRQFERGPLPDRFVEIAVDRAALNFIDVLKALGVYPGMGAGAVGLGTECAGYVSRVGAAVTHVREGQRVVAISPHALASHALAPAESVMALPADVSFEAAASSPSVFMTAWHALYDLARLERGERILIHSGAGGTGLAAIQLAQRVGATVIATAGTPEKREYLHGLGVEHVLSSRSNDFGPAIMRLTQGRGVDVVLNSLSGTALDTGLSVLAKDGRFIELGKRDIWSERPMTLAHFKRRITVSSVDMAGMAADRPERFAALYERVIRALAEREIAPLPITRFSAAQIEDGFRCMANAAHIGKIVFDFENADVDIEAVRSASPLFCPQSSYLVSGGLGALGMVLLKWMVERGARSIVVIARSAPTAQARADLDALEDAGAAIEVCRSDVSRREDVERAIATAVARGPLRGVFHLAGTLANASIAEADWASFDPVLGPKAVGARHLDVLTREHPLDLFVLFSSLASVMGSPGQASYAAANAQLDAIAASRRAIGLPAISIDWGPFAGEGLAARYSAELKRSARGLEPLELADMPAILDRLLLSRSTQVGVVKLDLRRLLDWYPWLAGAPVLSRLGKGASAPAVDAKAAQWLRDLQSVPERERERRFEELVTDQVAAVLRLDPREVDRSASLQSFGMDSLTGLELRNRLENATGVRLSATVVFTYPDITSIAKFLGRSLGLLGQSNAAASDGDSSLLDAAEIDQMSKAELESFLDRRSDLMGEA